MNSPAYRPFSEKTVQAKSQSSSGEMGAMYLKIFKLYLQMTARDRALAYGEKALEHYRMTNDKKALAFILEKLAELYDFFERYDSALMCYSQCEHLKHAGHQPEDDTIKEH